MMDFFGKVAIVTGGGSGVGRASARLLARQGVRVVVTGRRLTPLGHVVAEIRGEGGIAVAVAADFTRDGDARAAVQRAKEEFGRLDLAVNAAGSAYVSTLIEATEDLFDDVVAANLKTAWLAMKHQIPLMAETGGGAIVNVSSRAGLVGISHGSAYSAAKHAVIGLSKSAALEVAHLGIRVNVVCPGTTRTDQFERICAQIMPGTPPEEAARKLGAKVPLGRIAEPEEVAACIVWLLAPGASYITGAVVPIDGGVGAG